MGIVHANRYVHCYCYAHILSRSGVLGVFGALGRVARRAVGCPSFSL